jgi:hypothetical protein
MQAEELLTGIRDGDAHYGGIRCLRLFRIDRELARALLAEVDRLCTVERGSDVQEREHVTHWTQPSGAVRQFSLLNRSGDFSDYADDHDLSCLGKHFHHAARYPRLATFIGGFGHAINFRVNVLGAGAALAPHEEHSLFISKAGTPAVRARFHLPLRTARSARMMLEGDVYRFAPRTIYYFNQGCVHAASNPSGGPRIHLVWDLLLTPQIFALMFGQSAAPRGMQRLTGGTRILRPLARDPLLRYARLPPLVTPLEAQQVALCAVQ